MFPHTAPLLEIRPLLWHVTNILIVHTLCADASIVWYITVKKEGKINGSDIKNLLMMSVSQTGHEGL